MNALTITRCEHPLPEREPLPLTALPGREDVTKPRGHLGSVEASRFPEFRGPDFIRGLTERMEAERLYRPRDAYSLMCSVPKLLGELSPEYSVLAVKALGILGDTASIVGDLATSNEAFRQALVISARLNEDSQLVRAELLCRLAARRMRSRPKNGGTRYLLDDAIRIFRLELRNLDRPPAGVKAFAEALFLKGKLLSDSEEGRHSLFELLPQVPPTARESVESCLGRNALHQILASWYDAETDSCSPPNSVSKLFRHARTQWDVAGTSHLFRATLSWIWGLHLGTFGYREAKLLCLKKVVNTLSAFGHENTMAVCAIDLALAMDESSNIPVLFSNLAKGRCLNRTTKSQFRLFKQLTRDQLLLERSYRLRNLSELRCTYPF